MYANLPISLLFLKKSHKLCSFLGREIGGILIGLEWMHKDWFELSGLVQLCLQSPRAGLLAAKSGELDRPSHNFRFGDLLRQFQQLAGMSLHHRFTLHLEYTHINTKTFNSLTVFLSLSVSKEMRILLYYILNKNRRRNASG